MTAHGETEIRQAAKFIRRKKRGSEGRMSKWKREIDRVSERGVSEWNRGLQRVSEGVIAK